MELATIATVLAAMGGVLKLVLDALAKQRGEFTTFLENHMSANTEVLAQVVDGMRELHNDNLEAKKVLKHADKNVTRKVAEQNQKPPSS